MRDNEENMMPGKGIAPKLIHVYQLRICGNRTTGSNATTCSCFHSTRMTEAPQKKPLLEVIQTGEEDDETCRTFVMHNEDHTLGNSLRYILMKSADVQFCGYSIPHPSETKINFRIQTNGKPATEVLKKGLEDLKKLCQHVQKTFEHSMLEYKESHPEDAEMVEDT